MEYLRKKLTEKYGQGIVRYNGVMFNFLYNGALYINILYARTKNEYLEELLKLSYNKTWISNQMNNTQKGVSRDILGMIINYLPIDDKIIGSTILNQFKRFNSIIYHSSFFGFDIYYKLDDGDDGWDIFPGIHNSTQSSIDKFIGESNENHAMAVLYSLHAEFKISLEYINKAISILSKEKEISENDARKWAIDYELKEPEDAKKRWIWSFNFNF